MTEGDRDRSALAKGPTRANAAVILHAYYPEVWNEISSLLKNLRAPFDLFVTIPIGAALANEDVMEAFPQASIRRCENRGRDAAPFLSVLSEISNAGYKYICKLHTKKSSHTPHGARWRREMLNALIGSDRVVSRIKAAFDGHPDWGLIAPAGHVVPHLYYWSANMRNVVSLARSVGMPPDGLEFTFVAGSMFWFRPEALFLLNNTGLSIRDFEPEQEQRDGTMAHAVERFIGLAGRRAGFGIAESDSEGVRASSVSVHFNMLVESLNDSERVVDRASGQPRSDDSGTEPSSRHTSSEQVSIQALKGAHANETAWIIGKGPSLVMLSKEQIGSGPVIAINEATIAVEDLGLRNAVYSLQKDADRYEYGPGPVAVGAGVEPIASLRGATLLVHQHESASRMTDYYPRFVFDNVADFGLEWWEFSSLVAVAIAKLMGCSKVVFVAHDACVFGDTRTCTPKLGEAFQVDRDFRSAANYPQHRQRLDEYLAGASMEAQWVTPEPEFVSRNDARHLSEELKREVERLRLDLEESRGAGRRATHQLNGQVERLRLDLGESRGAVRRVTDELNGEVERLRASLDASHNTASALSTALSSTRTELGTALLRAQALTEGLSVAEDHVRALLSSASWRWTTPLRTAYDLLTRARSRGRRP